MGPTGAGKSTTVHFLAGSEMHLTSQGGMKHIDAKAVRTKDAENVGHAHSLWQHTHTHTLTHTHTHSYIHTYIHTYTHTHTHTHKHARTHIRMHRHTDEHTYAKYTQTRK